MGVAEFSQGDFCIAEFQFFACDFADLGDLEVLGLGDEGGGLFG